MIIAIEGIDGAGKNTLTTALLELLRQEHRSVTTLAFPRYEESVFAQLASKALHGEMGDLTDSAYAMATLFALDRRDALPLLTEYAEGPEVLLLDRYVASNAAYSIARTRDAELANWVSELEFGTFELPRPTLQVLLDTPVGLAEERARRREAQDDLRTRDLYETNADLQVATAQAYRRLARLSWESQWHSVSPDESVDEVAKALFFHISAR